MAEYRVVRLRLRTGNWQLTTGFSLSCFVQPRVAGTAFANVGAGVLAHAGQGEDLYFIGVSGQADVNLTGLDLGGIGLQVYAGRGSLGLAGRNVEPPLMSWALDDLAHHQAIRQTGILMSAHSIRCMESTRRMVNGVDLPT